MMKGFRILVLVVFLVGITTVAFAQGPLPVSGSTLIGKISNEIVTDASSVRVTPPDGFESIVTTDSDHGHLGIVVSTTSYTFTVSPGARIALRFTEPVTLTAVDGEINMDHVWVSDPRVHYKNFFREGKDQCDETHPVHVMDMVYQGYMYVAPCATTVVTQ